MAQDAKAGCGNRTAIVAGTRTPFVKAGTVFADHSMQDLGVHAISELVKRSELDPNKIDECIFGTVLLDPRTPNWAREMIFQAGLPKTISAHSVSNNCITGLLAVSMATENIFAGKSEVVIAGGTESMSKPSLLYNPKGAELFLKLSRARSFGQKLGLLAGFRPGFYLPKSPSVTEPSTGLTMGQHMEITAKEMGIARDRQDENCSQESSKCSQGYRRWTPN